MRQCAKIVKSYGTDGKVLVSFFGEIPEGNELKEPVFLYFEGLPVPFFFESIDPRGNSRAIVKFEDIDTLEDSDEISGLALFSEKNSAADEDDDGFDAEAVEGFTLCDESGTALGAIVKIDNFSGNICFTLDNGAIIPYNDDLLVNVNNDSRIITLTIPEGLLK